MIYDLVKSARKLPCGCRCIPENSTVQHKKCWRHKIKYVGILRKLTTTSNLTSHPYYTVDWSEE